MKRLIKTVMKYPFRRMQAVSRWIIQLCWQAINYIEFDIWKEKDEQTG